MVGPSLGTQGPHGSSGLDMKDPTRGRQRVLQATTVKGGVGALWEALYTALYWAQRSPHGPDTPEPTEAWVMQAKAMRNYHLHHPFNDRPRALPWTTDPPEARQYHAQVREGDDASAHRAPATGPQPAGYTPLLQTPRPPGSTSSSPAKASTKKKKHTGT